MSIKRRLPSFLRNLIPFKSLDYFRLACLSFVAFPSWFCGSCVRVQRIIFVSLFLFLTDLSLLLSLPLPLPPSLRNSGDGIPVERDVLKQRIKGMGPGGNEQQVGGLPGEENFFTSYFLGIDPFFPFVSFIFFLTFLTSLVCSRILVNPPKSKEIH